MLCAFKNFIIDCTSQSVGAEISLHLQPLKRCYCENSGSPSSARARKSGTLCHWSVTWLLPLLPSTTSVWRLIYVFRAQRSTARCADSTRCTQTRVYSARGKCIVRHWTSREASLRHSSGWELPTFPLSIVICAPVVWINGNQPAARVPLVARVCSLSGVPKVTINKCR